MMALGPAGRERNLPTRHRGNDGGGEAIVHFLVCILKCTSGASATDDAAFPIETFPFTIIQSWKNGSIGGGEGTIICSGSPADEGVRSGVTRGGTECVLPLVGRFRGDDGLARSPGLELIEDALKAERIDGLLGNRCCCCCCR